MKIGEKMYTIYFPRGQKWYNQHATWKFASTPTFFTDKRQAVEEVRYRRSFVAKYAKRSGSALTAGIGKDDPKFAQQADWLEVAEIITVELKEIKRESM